MFLGKRVNRLICKYMKSDKATLSDVVAQLIIDVPLIVATILIFPLFVILYVAAEIEKIKNKPLRILLQLAEIAICVVSSIYYIVYFGIYDILILGYNDIIVFCESITLAGIIYTFTIALVFIIAYKVCKYLGDVEVAHCQKKDR